MRALRPSLVFVVATVMLVAGVAPPAEAQRGPGSGGGKGRNRQGDQTTRDAPSAGEYPLEGPLVLQVLNRGEGPQALAYYERTAAQAEQQGDKPRAARAWHAVQIVSTRTGHYQKGIQAGNRSLDAFKAATGLTPSDMAAWAAAYSQLGAGYRLVGDLTRARQIYEEGFEFSRTRLSGRREGQAEGFILNGLATVALAQQDYQTALARSTQAAQFFESAEGRLGKNAPELRRTNLRRWAASSYLGIGRAELALDHPDAADAAFDRGLNFARQSGLREMELQLLAGQGSLALSRQDWAKALGIYGQSIALSNQIKRTGGMAGLYHGQSRALEGLGRIDEALSSAREAVRYVEELRADLGDASLRGAFLDDKQRIYQHAVLVALQAQHPDEAFALAEQSRSRTFLDLLGSQTTLSKGRTRALVDEEVKLRARLAEAQAQAQAESQEADAEGSGEGEPARPVPEGLDRDYRAFLERVRKESLEQASLMTVEPVTLPGIQALLPPDTTLLEYEVGEAGTILWVVDRQQFKVVRLPGDRPSLVGLVRRFRTAITAQAPVADVQALAQLLYHRLVGPARDQIRTSRLLIVPHGVLHYVPFGALRSPAGRWLVEDFALSTLPSASVLRYLVDKGKGAPARSLVVGNPDLGPALALPWAEREARMVGQREPDSTVLVRGDATELQVKKLVEGVGLVHFATHGELSESDPLSSAVLLVPGGGEDGRLEVREVFGLDLHARLVVLSACETGLGKLSRGDELVGLQRAFLYAGTPAVVTTLWKVDDRASYELVRALYDRLDGLGPVEALRQAQIETLRAYPHPFAWAAFGLTGAPAR
jgi:CHAT domain-containing protein